MLRTLKHHWRMNLAVLAGVAVATAVLTGALLVGDSVRGSLRALTLERLGGVDQALAGQRFFRPQLADDLAALDAFDDSFEAIAPAILLRGSVQHAVSKARASDVGLVGVGDRFLDLMDADEWTETLAAGGSIFPPALLNPSLAEALGAQVGDDILISLQRVSEVPEGSLLSRKDTGNVVGKVRLTVAAILPERGLGQFSLQTQQNAGPSLFVDRHALATALDQPGLVNSLVASQMTPGDSTSGEGQAHAVQLDDLLRQVLRLEDLGLELDRLSVPSPPGPLSRGRERGSQKDPSTEMAPQLRLQSGEFILDPAVEEVARQLVQGAGGRQLPVLTYLVNELRLGEARVPYSTVTALDSNTATHFGRWQLRDGLEAASLGGDEILLSPWTAEQLQATVGDRVEMTYFEVGEREELRLRSASKTVGGVLDFAGLAADEALTQEYPGIAGNSNMADWDPPFPIELDAIRPVDEDYWDAHRATPKAFIDIAAGRQAWSNRWGDLTSLRFVPSAEGSIESLETELRQGLVAQLPLQSFGLGFRPVKELGLSASGGATDFSGLFIGFSFFLILSAALLVGLLFSLGVEQRASEVGLLRAVGFTNQQVARQLLGEGAIVASLGAVLGLLGAVAYAQLMMLGLRTWWLPAVGTSRLELFVSPVTLIGGAVGSLLIVLCTIWWRLRSLRGTPIPSLLKHLSRPPATNSGRRSRVVAWVGLLLSGLCAALALANDGNPFLFGAAGCALLVGLLALFAQRLGHRGSRRLGRPGPTALLRMAAANGARHRGRSLLSTILVASASYMIVTVAAFEQDFSVKELGKSSGTGGFALVAESDIPLQQDLNSADGRFELGVDEATLPDSSQVYSLRLLPGDDTSCLNLYQPRQPRLVGVSRQLAERGGFTFKSTLQDLDESEDGWSLLRSTADGREVPSPVSNSVTPSAPIVPVVGDFNSMTYILKLGLGDHLVMTNEAGHEIWLRLVGTLETSIFQSELLLAEEDLMEHFPSLAGWSYHLVDLAGGREAAHGVAQALERDLEDYGFDAVDAAEKLESFHLVQNTYLSTFRTLGGLGLLLGTLGLAIVLLRGALERRGEMAAMRAFGFRRSRLLALIVAENAWLLLVGLVIGTLGALLTAASNLLHHAHSVPWFDLALTLGGIFLFALLACTLTAKAALSTPLLPALKADQ